MRTKNLLTSQLREYQTYNIRKEEVAENDPYELKELIIVTDANPGTPENYPTWEEVEPNASPAEDTPKGDTPGNLGPKHWDDPYRELFIKYVKKEQRPPDVSQYAEKFVYRV